MATSGTYTWSPTAGDLTLSAFGRCGLKRTELTAQHLADALLESNLLLVEFCNRQPNLWVSEEVAVSVTSGTATYTLAEKTIDIVVAFLRTTTGSTNIDTTISPLSMAEYAGITNKTTPGRPTSFWFNRQITPTLTLWPVPSTTYSLVLRQLSRIQDTVLQTGTNVALPYRWLDAFTAGLSARLAVIYAPDKAQGLMALAERAWHMAATEDEENVPIRITPQISNYFR